MEKFIEITKKDKGFDKENSWHKVCESQGIPFITVKARSKLADVQWDYISYPPSIDDAIFSKQESIKPQVWAIYDRYAAKNTSVSAGAGVITFRNLEVADAREVASELYDVIYEAVRTTLEISRAELQA